MKQRNKWKRHISVLLMVVMMLNTAFVAQAADVGWQKESGEDGRWFYLDKNGDMVTDEPKISNGKWYYLGADGFMVVSDLVMIGDRLFYAQSDGSFAENRWVKINDDWYHFGKIKVDGNDEDGVLVGGANGPGWAEIREKFYCFDYDYKMISQGFIKENMLDDSFNGSLYYAHEDGSLASKEWLNLSEDGKECNHTDENCGCSWYFFEKVKVNENGKLKGGAVMNGEVKPLDDEGYCYFKDGKMVAKSWCEGDDGAKHYYTSTGFRAVGQWLPINGYWYQFDKDGKVIAYAEVPGEQGDMEPDVIDDKATPSNVPYRTVKAVNPVKDVVEVLVGEKDVNIEFNVELASSSDAEYGSNDFTQNAHDMSLKSTSRVEGGVKVTDRKNGKCTVTFNAGMTAKEDEIVVYIDDVKSAPVTVKTVLPKEDTPADEGKKEVGQAIDNILKPDAGGNINTVEAVKGLKNVYEVSKDETEDHLLDNINDLKNVDDKHALENGIDTMPSDISEKVQGAVGNVTVTGAALNAERGDSVQLKVDEPKEEWTLNKGYTNTAAFDIRLLIMGADGKDKLEDQSGILDIPVVITMKLPAGFTANGLELFNIHNGTPIKVNFRIVGSNIRFITDRFSTYVFAQNSSTTTSPTGGGGRGNDVNSALTTNSGSNSGEWILDDIGWWIRLKDGTYPVNTWMYLEYNGIYKWYHFDNTGYMNTGWFTDADGRRYYLNPISDGTRGAMLTGWQFIDGYWYYFNPVSDGTQGALLVNTTTPDGYAVNANGQWIQ